MILTYLRALILYRRRRFINHLLTYLLTLLAENRDFFKPPAFDTHVMGGGVHVGILSYVWYGKTRMVWLPDGEKKV